MTNWKYTRKEWFEKHKNDVILTRADIKELLAKKPKKEKDLKTDADWDEYLGVPKDPTPDQQERCEWCGKSGAKLDGEHWMCEAHQQEKELNDDLDREERQRTELADQQENKGDKIKRGSVGLENHSTLCLVKEPKSLCGRLFFRIRKLLKEH